MPTRTTTVVPDRLAAHRARLEHARAGQVGRHVTTLPGLAARLAGGFLRAPMSDELERALQPPPDLRSGDYGPGDPGPGGHAAGGLASIAMLPGFPRAVASTLLGAWSRGIDIAAQAAAEGAHPRWRDLRTLEVAAIATLPPGAVAPPDLVRAALERVRHAPTLIGSVALERLADVEPAYRPLIAALAEVVPVTWLQPGTATNAHRDWLATTVEVRHDAAATPDIHPVACADPEHEVREALRWARRHLSEGRAPAELAIATASIAAYDDLMHALASESGLPLHAAAGWSALVTPPGQHAAALAELVVRGIDQERVVRFVRTGLAVGNERLTALSDDWSRMLPEEATLNSPERWRNALDAPAVDAPPTRRDAAALILALVDEVHAVCEGAPPDALGARWLSGAARALWERALSSGPAAGLDLSLAGTRMSDGVDPAAAIVWAPAATLVGSPRPITRLLGLAARSWPRRGASDPLLPDHVLGPLAPLRPDRAARDRADFDALLRSSASEVVLSRPRRGLDGRAQAPSPLLRSFPPARDVHPAAPLEHAFSEADRRQARPAEFAAEPRAVSALTAWRAWLRPELTPHDGLVRREHPALAAATGRRHSATSLRLLLRSPLGFVARYALGWSEPVLDDAPFTLDPLERGSLLHDVLERAVVHLEASGGLAASTLADRERAIGAAIELVRADWELEHRVPPAILWTATLADTRRQALAALDAPFTPLPDQRSFVEVPFGGQGRAGSRGATAAAPWDVDARVTIPGTDVEVGGYVDRLDLATDGTRARVVDYKSGSAKPPADLDGGRELQRALYASAVRSLLGAGIEVEAHLLHTRTGTSAPLHDPDRALTMLATATRTALSSLAAGRAIPGPDSFEDYAEVRLALPADADVYRRRKEDALAAARAEIDAAFEAQA